MHPVETSVRRAFPWLLGGLAASLLLLAVEANLETVFITHLVVLVTFSLGLAFVLDDQADREWFPSIERRPVRRFAGASAVVIVVTGVVALVTLASSAALRFDPSTQLLQLLSALDIAWATTALMVGVRWARGAAAARAAAIGLGVVCVWSIWRYIDNVGFGPNGEWLVTRDALLEFVLPYDTAAALLAVGAVIVGIKRGQETEQPRPQS